MERHEDTFCMKTCRQETHFLCIVANHGKRADPLAVEAEVLRERLCESNAVPVSHEPPYRPCIMLRVPRSEALGRL